MPVLLYSPKMETLARQVQALDPERIELGIMEWQRFPDGFPDLRTFDPDLLRARDVAFLACLDTPDRVFEEVSMMQKLAALRPNSFRIALPYFPTGTMERGDEESQVVTAKTLASIMSTIAPSGSGPVPLYVWDLHALQNLEFFGQNIAPRGKWGVKTLLSKLRPGETAIAFPDEGAYKRFKRVFCDKDLKPLYPFVLCYKERYGAGRKVRIIEGDPRGKDVVIIDDLIHSGGTIIKCLEALKAAGAERVSAYATHGVMEEGAWRKFLTAGFDKVWITDTCPDTAKTVDGQGPFEVLSIAESVREAIMDGLRFNPTSAVATLAAILQDHLAGKDIGPALARLIDELKNRR